MKEAIMEARTKTLPLVILIGVVLLMLAILSAIFAYLGWWEFLFG